MERVEALFLEAIELPAEERAAFLARECGNDLELLAEVERMLEATDAVDRWLEGLGGRLRPITGEATPEADAESFQEQEASRPPADRVGPWRVVERLGRGGMGTVWLGERDDGAFEQQVAIKFLGAGDAGSGLIQRFEAERRILARLEHPNIARLLDGGVTDRGVPWLAMERVQGSPIDRWCDQQGLDVEARVRLFRQVCEAVQQAHRQLVVHRDLKPANILVDQAGRAKLLDFGIAKVLEDEEAPGAPSLLTRIGGSPLTPAFASPEQLRGAPVTTASDVYALGVLLYLLLSGRAPYALEGLAFDEVVGRVAEGAPPPPSRVVADESEGGAVSGPEERAQRRGTSPERLRRRLRGDLDTIVLQAMHPEPQRRYATVEQLALDLERWERGLPIGARPDSRAYRARKFVGRHRAAVAAAVVLPLLAVGALLAHADRLGQERDRAVVEAQRAEQVTAFLTSLFDGADPAQARGEEITARELLERGAERIDAFEGDPRARAELHRTLGRVQASLGAYAEAEAHYRQALALAREAHGPESLEAAEAMAAVALQISRQGRHREAEALLRDALPIARREGPDTAVLARVIKNLGSVTQSLGLYDESEALRRENLELRGRIEGKSTEDHALAVNELGVLLHARGRYTEAEELFGEALSIRRERLGEDHPDTLSSLSNVASAVSAAGDYERAAELYGEVISLRRRVLGDAHPELATALFQQGVARRLAGHLEEAEAAWQESLAIRRVALGPAHPDSASTLNALAAVAYDRDDFDTSSRLLEEALEIQRKAYGERHPATVTLLANLGNLKWVQGRREEAEPLYLEALRLREELLGPDHPEVATSLRDLAGLYRDSGRPQAGLVAATRALDILTAALSEGHPLVQQVQELLEELEAAQPESTGS